MTVKLLTEHHLKFLSLRVGRTDLAESTCQNATLLEITCCGSIMFWMLKMDPNLTQSSLRLLSSTDTLEKVCTLCKSNHKGVSRPLDKSV